MLPWHCSEKGHATAQTLLSSCLEAETFSSTDFPTIERTCCACQRVDAHPVEENMALSGNQSKAAAKQARKQNRALPSSHGDSPVEVTPKDISPEDASWQDRTERQLATGDRDEKKEAVLDEAVELTFPASDPIAPASVTKIVKTPSGGKKETAGK
jgi:hypothetical protein